MKLTVTKSKNSACFYVQKSIRKPNGAGTTTITIEKLGNIDEVKAKAKGQDPYKQAQEYVNELNRKEYEEQKSIIVSYSPAKLIKSGEQKSFKAHFITCFIALFVYRILEKKVGEKYTCEQLIDTMRDMIMERPGNGQGYIPIYTRTKITDALHETAGFRTDYEILTDISMKKAIRLSKGKKK